jgi:hypothetical protein
VLQLIKLLFSSRKIPEFSSPIHREISAKQSAVNRQSDKFSAKLPLKLVRSTKLPLRLSIIASNPVRIASNRCPALGHFARQLASSSPFILARKLLGKSLRNCSCTCLKCFLSQRRRRQVSFRSLFFSAHVDIDSDSKRASERASVRS